MRGRSASDVQDHRRVRLVDEQVAAGPHQAGGIMGPPARSGIQIRAPLPVRQFGARAASGTPGTAATTYRQAARSSSARRWAARSDLAVIDPDHRFRARPHQGTSSRP